MAGLHEGGPAPRRSLSVRRRHGQAGAGGRGRRHGALDELSAVHALFLRQAISIQPFYPGLSFIDTVNSARRDVPITTLVLYNLLIVTGAASKPPSHEQQGKYQR